MNKEQKIDRVLKSCKKLEIAINKRILATKERRWVEQTPKIHVLNYWYYRYCTNEFELFLVYEK